MKASSLRDFVFVGLDEHSLQLISVSGAGLDIVQGQERVEPVQSPCTILCGFEVLQGSELVLADSPAISKCCPLQAFVVAYMDMPLSNTKMLAFG